MYEKVTKDVSIENASSEHFVTRLWRRATPLRLLQGLASFSPSRLFFFASSDTFFQSPGFPFYFHGLCIRSSISTGHTQRRSSSKDQQSAPQFSLVISTTALFLLRRAQQIAFMSSKVGGRATDLTLAPRLTYALGSVEVDTGESISG